jgi:putative Mg2+ transporter-C (MgtC) family protein
VLSENDLTILWRAALAAALGLLIGWERQATGSAIKARTIALAALTAASLTALGHEIFGTGTDRIVQGIVTGIGFLGAGVIIHGASGEVRGLTTAATMWAMTGVGVAVGSGHELLGALLAVLIYVIIASGQWPVLAWFHRRSSRTVADKASQRLVAESAAEVSPTIDTAKVAWSTQPTERAEEHR